MRSTVLLPLALAAFALAGCPAGTSSMGGPSGDAPFNPQATAGDVHVRENQQFEDIPVPYGFRLRRDNLFSYQGSMFRYGTFTYEGLWRAPDTRNFYREQMATHGWEYKDTRPTALRDGEMAVFHRDREVAEVVVRELPNRIRVDVTVRNRDYTDPLVLARANRGLAENPAAITDDMPASTTFNAPSGGFVPTYTSATATYPANAGAGAATPLRPSNSSVPAFVNTDPLLPSGLGIVTE